MTDQWRLQAACRGMDTELFFPGHGQAATLAKRACAACPVQAECGADAASHHAHGIWAGRSWTKGHAARAGTTPRSPYTDAERIAAIDLYRRVRPHHRSERAALEAVTATLRISTLTTVRDWVRAELPLAERAPNQRATLAGARRSAALAMLRQIRHKHPSERSAARAVAERFGLAPGTVTDWAREARRAQRESLGAAA